MKWELEWGDKLTMLEGLANTGVEVPALEARPDISGFEWLWSAFSNLNTCRTIGFSVGSIPWTAIQKYTEVHEMSPFETLLFHSVMRAMDQVFIQHQNAKATKKRR